MFCLSGFCFHCICFDMFCFAFVAYGPLFVLADGPVIFMAYGPLFVSTYGPLLSPVDQVRLFIICNIVFCYTFVQVCNCFLLIIQIVFPYLLSISNKLSSNDECFCFHFLSSWFVIKRYHQLPIRSIGFNIAKIYCSL